MLSLAALYLIKQSNDVMGYFKWYARQRESNPVDISFGRKGAGERLTGFREKLGKGDFRRRFGRSTQLGLTSEADEGFEGAAMSRALSSRTSSSTFCM